jgi:DNA-binding SARP family transcriptional activator
LVEDGLSALDPLSDRDWRNEVLDEMKFRLIGPVEIDSVGRVVQIGSPQQRLLAAALAVDAGRPVSVESLIGRVWDDPPAGARRTLHVLVSKMRRTLEDASRNEPEGATVVRQSGGYVMQLSPDRVDLLRFRRLTDDARRSNGEAQAKLLRGAVALWQGEPLCGLPGDWAGRARAVWQQEYLAATVAWANAELQTGNPAATIGPLTVLAAEHPLAEPVSAALILALCAVCRPADALAHYARVRQRLADELGADPGAELRAAFQTALCATSRPLDAIRASRSGPVTVGAAALAGGGTEQPTMGAPQQLPTAPRLFTGRTAELASLTAAFDDSSAAADTAQIAVIHGIAGVGKSWLALHWAHQHVDRFPDGQLWLNLRGFDPSEPPLDIETALRSLLDALGVAPATVPATVPAQIGLYRSLVAGKRVLLVLDNVRDTSQVAPLLPGSPACRVLVTSRHHLAGIVTAHDALPLSLDGLSEPDAWKLLAGRLGASRLAAEPAAAADLISYCAGLPLAVSIVAARAKAHPTFSLADLAASLAGDANRLDGLDAGEPTASVRAALSWSCHALAPAAAVLFPLLGLAPGPDINTVAAASLGAMTMGQAQAALRELEHANLVQQHALDRYRMHDLVALYALEQVSRDLPPAARTAALRRVIDYYLHTAVAGERLLSIPRHEVSLDPQAPGSLVGHLPDSDAALQWFRAEYECLLAAQRTAAAQGWHDVVWQLAWATETFHRFQGKLHNWVAVWRNALAASYLLGRPAVQAMASRCLGEACARTGQSDEALTHLSLALSVAEDADDMLSQAHTHRTFALAWEARGDWQRALSHALTARCQFEALGFSHWTADALAVTGWCHAHLGEHTHARTALHEALDLLVSQRDRHGQANVQDSLGYVALNLGDYAQAVQHYTTALALWRGLDHTHGEADALAGLAVAYAALGDQLTATRIGDRARTLFRDQHRPADAAQLQQDLLARALPRSAHRRRGARPGEPRQLTVNDSLGDRATRPADTGLGGRARADAGKEATPMASVCARGGIREWKLRDMVRGRQGARATCPQRWCRYPAW